MIFGHKQEILVIVLVKFRHVTELFILELSRILGA